MAVNPKFVPQQYHKVVSDALEKFVTHEIRNLIVVMPPRHGKSELASRGLPAWILGRAPDRKIIAASHTAGLAEKNSRDVKKFMLSREHAEVLGKPNFVKTTDEEWELEEGGAYKAVGAGAGVSGFGADYIVVDDYIRTRQQAESETERNRLWQWFLDDILTRRHGVASTLVMATRWHQDDIIGRILHPDYGTGEPWTVIHLPKRYEGGPQVNGEYRTAANPMMLSPFTMAPWEYLPGMPVPKVDPLLKRTPTPVTWEELQDREAKAFQKQLEKNYYGTMALYQGNPTPKGGGLFNAGFRYYNQSTERALADADQVIISVDASFKGGEKNDNCVFLVVAKHNNLLLLVDQVCAKMDWTALVANALSLSERYPLAKLVIEDKANGPALINELRGRVPRVVPFDPGKHGSKAARAQLAADRYESGTILHPPRQTAPWLDAFEAELETFPYAPHDDRVDALSQAVLYFDATKSGRGLQHVNTMSNGMDLINYRLLHGL